MNIENLLRDFILRNYRSLRSFAVKNNLPPTTINFSSIALTSHLSRASLPSVMPCISALRHWQTVKSSVLTEVDSRCPSCRRTTKHCWMPITPCHRRSSRWSAVWSALSIPTKNKKRTNSTHEEDTRMNRHEQELLAAYRTLDAEQQRLICRTLGISMPEENNPKGK